MSQGSMIKSAAWVRAADKSDVTVRPWKTGRMPKTIIRTKGPFTLSGSWCWRVINFSIRPNDYTVLLAHRAERADFMAMLFHNDKEATLLCRVEHHGSHPGWHVHYQSERPFITGVTNFPRLKKRDCGGDSGFGTPVVSGFDAWAMTLADKLFNFEPHDDGLL